MRASSVSGRARARCSVTSSRARCCGRSAVDRPGRNDSQLRRCESVAGLDVAGLDAAAEPLHTLGAGAVREGVRDYGSLRATLQRVVADLCRSIQRRLDIAGLQPPAVLRLRPLRPNAREAIRLQLDSDAVSGGPRTAIAAGGSLPVENPEQSLHMVTHLVRDHVRMRELAGRAELARHDVEEAQIQVDAPVIRAIERAGSRIAVPARGGIGIAIEQQLRILVRAPEFREGMTPDYLSTAQDL